jgi:type II secretory pathway predicted ATPase ExeA/LysM repeat protein
MYNAYFGFSASPFENTLDQNFFFLSADHSEMLGALLYFVHENKGFALVSGDVGTGKTMVINSFLEKLPESVHPIIVSNPNIMYLELLHYIAKQLQLNKIKENILELTDDIKQALIEYRKEGKRYILIVDEAHLLSDSSLEDIRLLSNIETRREKLLQILLVGQYELSHKLDRPEMRQLRQRINISRFLSPLNPPETNDYVNYRLNKVGSSFDACFEPIAKKLMFKMTGGVPRMINQLCDSALLICMTENCRKVDRAILKRAREALLTDRILTPQSSGKRRNLGRILRRSLITAACAAFLAAVVMLGQKGVLGEDTHQLINTLMSSKIVITDWIWRGTGEKSEKGGIAPGAKNEATPAQKEDMPLSQAPTVKEGLVITPVSKTVDAGAPISQGQAKTSVPPTMKIGRNKLAPGGVTALGDHPDSGLRILKDASARNQIVVKPGDYLSKLATRYYPQNPDLGLEAIILANLINAKEDIIHPGQVLYLPEIKSEIGLIQLRDGLYYAPYGHFRAFQPLQEAMASLSQLKVRYLVINSIDSKGSTTHRLIMGGYERYQDLEKALKLVKLGASQAFARGTK